MEGEVDTGGKRGDGIGGGVRGVAASGEGEKTVRLGGLGGCGRC